MSFALSGSRQYLIRHKNSSTQTAEGTRLDLTGVSGSETASPRSKRYGQVGWTPKIGDKDTPRMLIHNRPESKVSMTEFSQPKSSSVSTRLYKPAPSGPKSYFPSDPYHDQTKKLLNDFECSLE